ncbi:MAG: hypothetical protein U9Q90_00775 [Campylobacterota bacterium]|nr:hypothetical protein [Campylobacterota bacterium]
MRGKLQNIMFRVFILYSLLLLSTLQAETIKEIAEKAHLASINALLIFTSQEGLSSGVYHFTDAGVDMEVYHLPFTYQFESKESAINYFVVGNVGYSRVFISQEIELLPPDRLDYNNHIRTYTAGLGGGVRYKATEEIHFSGGIELIYSRSGASVKNPDDDMGDAIEDFFSQEYNDNISYKFFTLAEYRPVINDFKPYATLSYKLYETKSTFDFDELMRFDTESSVTTLALGIETPQLLQHHSNYLTLESYINGNYLTGAVEKAVQFNLYSTVSAVVYWYTPDDPWWAERFFFEASAVQSDGLSGHNLGVGFTVDF